MRVRINYSQSVLTTRVARAHNTGVRFADMLAEATDGLTQTEVAERSGVDQATICRLLNRTSSPRYDTMLRLERAFPKLRELRNREAA